VHSQSVEPSIIYITYQAEVTRRYTDDAVVV